jgi:16S rRNA (guanine527-N7)-methyltransferase
VADAAEQILAAGAGTLGLDIGPQTQQRLLQFIAAIRRWNKVMNLTSILNPEEMVTRHLLDSLAISRHLHGRRVIDVGTGAGLPGIPLALVHPQIEFVLLDARAKRTRFVRQMVIELELANVECVHSRVEDYHPSQRFDTVVSRAFSGLSDMLNCCAHLPDPDGRFIAMKGVDLEPELAAVPTGFAIAGIYPVEVPGLEGGRSVVDVRPEKTTGLAS